MKIYDYLGNEIYTTAVGNGKATWNLTKDHGEKVGNGAYVVSLEVTYNNGTKERIMKKVGVSE